MLLTGKNPPPPPSPQNMTLCLIGRVRFERNCGKMYCRHLFPYGGFCGRVNVHLVPDIKMKHQGRHPLSKALHCKLWRTVKLKEGTRNNTTMTAVVNDAPILPRFHAWQHSLDQSQGTKEVHFKQFLGHFHSSTFQWCNQSQSGIINWWIPTFISRDLKIHRFRVLVWVNYSYA